ncbi:phosphoribosyltransferase family protein [Halomonas sp. RT37]|uniref:Phosphoribosyltransferase domain-containing protein n=1 Tax=Halomonas sp. RT37 TaxID=2950872 RepID=A0AAU7KEX8_9GAMM
MGYSWGDCNSRESLNMVTIHPQKIEGRWQSGVALDFHTTSSTPIGYNEYGHMQFDTVRPEIAELLYQLKYQGRQDAAAGIIEAAAAFLASYRDKFDILVPVPPSSARAVQPVIVLARGIGTAANLPVVECITTTRETTQLKGVTDPERRKELVDGLYTVDASQTSGRNVLLFDDLFRSGTTMNAITDVLLGPGRAASVRALTITKTRSNQ